MPLTFDPVAPKYMPICEGQPAVTLRAHVEGAEPRELVSVRIHEDALDLLLTQASNAGVGGGQAAMEEAADQFRPIILAVAIAKFDSGDWTLDGVRKVVLIRLGDVVTTR